MRAGRLAAIAMACLVLAYLLAFAAVAMASLRYGPVPQAGGRPAVAVVFYTDAPSERAARVERAVGLWREGVVEVLIMAGGARPGRDDGYRGALEMAEDAARSGVPRDALRYDAVSNDTLSNLREAVRHAAGLRARTLVMVSDRLHLVRIELVSRRDCAQFDCHFAATAEVMTWRATIRRVNHEILAYGSLLLPRAAVEAWLARTREAALGGRAMVAS